MHEHWEHKKRRSGGMSNAKIDELYELAMNNGAVGGKLVGAGGGGFLMSMPRTAIDCGIPWPGLAWRKCASASTSKAPRLSSPELLPVAILAGGLANRLRPITETIPKALVTVAGEPFLFHQLRYLKAQGVAHVVICTGYLGEQVEAAVGNGHAFGLKVEISPDGPVLLGTGGALKTAAPKLGDAFFVLYGDSFLPCDFGKVQSAFEASGKPALMTVLRNGDRWDKSNVVFVDGSCESIRSGIRRLRCSISTTAWG